MSRRTNHLLSQAITEQLEPRRLLATITVTSTADSITPDDGAVTLREAITAINAGSDLGDPDITAQNPTATNPFGVNDTIDFNIPGGGVRTVDVGSDPTASGLPLPALAKPIDIDGTTQPGFDSTTHAPLIELDGADATAANSSGFVLNQADSTIRGFIINNFNDDGILVQDSAENIAGNYLGTDATGTTAEPNAMNGIESDGGDGVTIGGLNPGDGNVISGNTQNGIAVNNGQVDIYGNYIGTDATGLVARGNGADGLALFGACMKCVIGGTTAAARNVICSNVNGISTGNAAVENYFEGNYIGVGANGSTALGNQGDGMRMQDESDDDFIGGPLPADANVIANNAFNGITIGTGASDTTIDHIEARLNSIYNNGRLGIDIGNDGITSNDSGDADTGPNGLQNFPVLGSANSDAGSTTIQGSLNSTGSTQFIIDFYSNASVDLFQQGEGKTYLGSTTVNTDGSGFASFNVTIPVGGLSGQFLSATATDMSGAPYGQTSEFATDVEISPPILPLPTLSIVNATGDEGNSGTTPFIFAVNRSGDTSGTSFVAISTADGTATVADHDYQPNAAILTFAPGVTSQNFTLLVNGDTKVEPDETFYVNLSGATGATIATAQAQGLIINDDVPPPPPSGSVSIITDPSDSTKTALDITGTNNPDTITVTKSGSSQGKAVVKINGVNKGTFSFSGSILIYGKDGNDNISVDSGITRSAWIWGGDGKDTVNGGGGNDFILGQDGDDSLNGNGGRDILIGGDGADKLNGGSGDDVLIAGDFKSSTPSMSQLASLQKEWDRTDKNYSSRVKDLTNGGGYNTIKLNGSTLFSSTTLKDTLTGGADNDLFFAAMSGDKITDKASGETVVDIG